MAEAQVDATQKAVEIPLKEKELEPKKNTMGYLVSYCDIMTLCLTFFIILSTMAEEQQKLAFQTGIGSFRTSIKTLGLAGILTKSTKAVERDFLDPAAVSLVPFVDKELRFRVDKATDDQGFSPLEADAVEYLEKGYEVWIPTGIRFRRGERGLSREDVAKLAGLAEFVARLEGKVQVVGTSSPDEGSLGEGYRLAVGRAEEVYKVLNLKGFFLRGDMSLRGYRWPAFEKILPGTERTVDLIVHRR